MKNLFRRFGLIFFIAAYLIVLVSCNSLQKPITKQEGLDILSEGGRVEYFDNLLAYQNNEKIDSVLIYKNGSLLLERYAKGYYSDSLHDLRSATKSIGSLLLGIAIDQGFIQSIDQSILDYFPEQALRHPDFKQISIRHLLIMSSGLDSDDWIPSSIGNEEKMYQTGSWIEFFFSLPFKYKPGTEFHYSTAGVVLLGEIIKRASKLKLDEFAEKYLFRDLDIADFQFAFTPAGETDAGGHLRLKPRDFAKIGLLVLQNGMWNGKQLVSQKWIAQINQPAIMIPGFSQTGPYMGFLWWQEPVVDGEVRSFQARGNGGQYLIAVPSEHILGVFTGSAFNDNQQMQAFLLMKSFVIPAFRKDPSN